MTKKIKTGKSWGGKNLITGEDQNGRGTQGVPYKRMQAFCDQSTGEIRIYRDDTLIANWTSK